MNSAYNIVERRHSRLMAIGAVREQHRIALQDSSSSSLSTMDGWDYYVHTQLVFCLSFLQGMRSKKITLEGGWFWRHTF